jgi:hypothetical protein
MTDVFGTRNRILGAIAWITILFLSAAPARAQAPAPQDPEHHSAFADVVRGVVLDPTTYAPSVMLYESMHLDWVSSQPFFRNGFVEDNSRYTISGLPHDVPVGYGEGNRRILMDSLQTLPTALAHNTVNRLVERMLIDRFPGHPRMIRTFSWVERIAFASYLSYGLSKDHFHQWSTNDRLAGQLGYK